VFDVRWERLPAGNLSHDVPRVQRRG
jgi:hypothetical protein